MDLARGEYLKHLLLQRKVNFQPILHYFVICKNSYEFLRYSLEFKQQQEALLELKPMQQLIWLDSVRKFDLWLHNFESWHVQIIPYFQQLKYIHFKLQKELNKAFSYSMICFRYRVVFIVVSWTHASKNLDLRFLILYEGQLCGVWSNLRDSILTHGVIHKQ